MLTFKKGNDVKYISEVSPLIEKLKATGWQTEEKAEPRTVTTEEKVVKNGKSSKSGN